MTLLETAEAMRRAADVFERVAKTCPANTENPFFGKVVAMLGAEQAASAAGMLCFIRDLLTNSPRETYPREDLLVILETISRDPEVFPCGIGLLMWQAENEDELEEP